MAKDEPLELLVGEDKEITEGDQEASVIKFVNQIIWEAFKDPRDGHSFRAGGRRVAHPLPH